MKILSCLLVLIYGVASYGGKVKLKTLSIKPIIVVGDVIQQPLFANSTKDKIESYSGYIKAKKDIDIVGNGNATLGNANLPYFEFYIDYMTLLKKPKKAESVCNVAVYDEKMNLLEGDVKISKNTKLSFVKIKSFFADGDSKRLHWVFQADKTKHNVTINCRYISNVLNREVVIDFFNVDLGVLAEMTSSLFDYKNMSVHKLKPIEVN